MLVVGRCRDIANRFRIQYSMSDKVVCKIPDLVFAIVDRWIFVFGNGAYKERMRI